MAKKAPWITKNKKVVYDNSWISVEHHEVKNPSGNDGIYGLVHFKNLAIGVVALDEERNTWLVGQYRYPLKQFSWEIPEGGGPLHIDPLVSAKRELLEETGIIANSYQELFTMHLSNSVSDEFAIVYLATDLEFTEASPEETEDLVVKRLPLEEAIEMAENGQITDSLSLAAMQKMKILSLEKKI